MYTTELRANIENLAQPQVPWVVLLFPVLHLIWCNNFTLQQVSFKESSAE